MGFLTRVGGEFEGRFRFDVHFWDGFFLEIGRFWGVWCVYGVWLDGGVTVALAPIFLGFAGAVVYIWLLRPRL